MYTACRVSFWHPWSVAAHSSSRTAGLLTHLQADPSWWKAEDAHKDNLKQNTCMLDESICSSCKGGAVQEVSISRTTDGTGPRNTSDRMAPSSIAPGRDEVSWPESEPIIFWQT